jgi:DNA-directed RNA polymerase specialized sigma24 family protein
MLKSLAFLATSTSSAFGATIASSTAMTVTDTNFAQSFIVGFPRTAAFLRSHGIAAHTAEELAQAAWAKGWEARHQLDNPDRLLPWVNAIALNLLRSSYRSPRMRNEVEMNGIPLTSGSFEPQLAASLDLAVLMTVLKPRDVSLVEQCYLEGQTTTEASAQHSSTPLALRLRLHRAVSSLRRAVEIRSRVLTPAAARSAQAA